MMISSEIKIAGIESLNTKLRDWGLDFVQLDRGILETGLTKAEMPGISLQHISFSKKIWQRGSPPSNAITFGILTSDEAGIVWNNQAITPTTLELFGREDKFDIVSPAGFSALTFSVNYDELMQLKEQCGIPLDIDLISLAHRVEKANPLVLNKLKMLSEQILYLQPFENAPHFAEELKSDLGYLLISAMDSPKVYHLPMIKLPRDRLIQKAMIYIQDNISTPILVGELCSQVYTSARTLTRCFQSKFGLSPKEVITYLRLHAFRRCLIENPQLKIYQIASLFGFWHLSKLTQDYKVVFGELPTQTRLKMT
ncbi:helix-turn-helix domain-containing protein [Agarivorans sp. MS3-6]